MTSIGCSTEVTDAVLGSLVVEMMALKSFVLGSTMPCSGQASVFAGRISDVTSCVWSSSLGTKAGKGSWLGDDKDTELSGDVRWDLAAGFVSVKEQTKVLVNSIYRHNKSVKFYATHDKLYGHRKHKIKRHTFVTLLKHSGS